MVICHISLNGPYNDGWNYQENLLPKYHSKMGLEVHQIISSYMWCGTKLSKYSGEMRYTNSDGVKLYRCIEKKGFLGMKRFDRFPELFSLLCQINPDIIFVHDMQFLDIKTIVKYLKKCGRHVTTYVDNHSDFYNSAKNWISKNILHRLIWKRMAHLIEPYTKKFYGVLPARVDFLVNFYKLPQKKCELLLLGADDEQLNSLNDNISITDLHPELNIHTGDIVFVTGGKIDSNKSQVINLMKAFSEFKNNKQKLLIFGTVSDELKDDFYNLISNNKNISFVGWCSSIEIYKLFRAADIVLFPGLHSVLWEQAVACGKACVFKKIIGFNHVDLGGNCIFFEDDSITSYYRTLVLALNNYKSMEIIAKKKGPIVFSYERIAKQAIEME